MEPYTVSGLAKLEGEVIDCDYEESVKGTCTKYQLTGIVVHSGQASGGHYYSYILHRYFKHANTCIRVTDEYKFFIFIILLSFITLIFAG